MTRIWFPRLLPRVAVLTAIAMLITACGSDGAPGTDAGGDTEPVSGGTLRVGMSVDTGCLDPWQSRARIFLMLGRTLADSLLYQEPEEGELVPWLAESWTVSEDASSYTFSLREGVTFSDGTAFNADVVKSNFDAIVELGAQAISASQHLTGYVGTTVLDDLTARVDFEAPNAPFLQAVSTVSLAMLSTEAAGSSAEERCSGETLVGSGPFVLEEYNPDRNILVSKRSGYDWAPEGLMHSGEAHLDAIDYQIIPETGVRAGAIVSDQLDVTMDLTTPDIPQLEAAGVPIIVRPNPGLSVSFFVNTRRPVVDDVAVRQAVLMGVDRQQILDTVLSKFDVAATSILSSTTPGYVDLGEQLAYDPEGASALLDEAGWQMGPDGVRVKDGQRLTFSLTYQTPQYAVYLPFMELTRQQLADIGIDMTLRPLPTAEALAVRTVTLDYDLLFSAGTRADGDVLRTYFTGRSDTLDAVLTEQLQTPDTDERAELLAEAQRIILDEAIAIPAYELVLPHGHRNTVQGLHYDAESLLMLYDAWLSN